MKVTSHRIILYGEKDHAFLIEGEKINEILLTVHAGVTIGIRFFVGKINNSEIANIVRESQILHEKLQISISDY